MMVVCLCNFRGKTYSELILISALSYQFIAFIQHILCRENNKIFLSKAEHNFFWSWRIRFCLTCSKRILYLKHIFCDTNKTRMFLLYICSWNSKKTYKVFIIANPIQRSCFVPTIGKKKIFPGTKHHPLTGSCQHKNFVYSCRVSTPDIKQYHPHYIVHAEHTFKDRLYKSNSPFNDVSKKNSTTF